MVLAVVGVCLADAAPASGQWYASASWGASEDIDATTDASVQSLQLGLQGFTDAGRLLLAGGIPARSGRDLTWGLVEAATSPFVGGHAGRGFGFQPDLLARGFLYHDPLADLDGSGGLLLAEPYAAYSGRNLRARLGGGARIAGTRVAGTAASRTAGVAAGDLVVTPGRRATLRVRAEVLRFDSRTLPHGQLTAHVRHDHGALWASVDRWQGDALEETGWYLGGSLELTADLAARVAVGRASGDPLFDTPSRNTWSISLRYRFADRPGRDAAADLPQYGTDGVQLRVPAEGGRGALSVGGSFNGWQPVPMTRSGDDWIITLDLSPGYYELAFVDESGDWFVPEDLPGRRPDGMGGWVMVLVVS